MGARVPGRGVPSWGLGWRVSLWLALILLLILAVVHAAHREQRVGALNQAKAAFQRDLVYRRWAAEQGGVYVPTSDLIPPNPLLKGLPHRDITTRQGQTLTLLNPAYMTRLVHEFGQREYGLLARITSLKPLRPGNAPDAWENSVLQRFEKGEREHWEVSNFAGQPHLRFMGAFLVDTSCLKCHSNQGYQVGQVRGGLSVAVPLGPHPLLDAFRTVRLPLLGLGLMGGLGLWFILAAWRRECRAQAAQEAAQAEAEASQRFHKSLTDLLPIQLFRLDREGRFTYGNPAFLKAMGLDAETLWGRAAQEVLGDLPEAVADAKAVLEGETRRRTLMLPGKDQGPEVALEIIQAPVTNYQGSVVEIQCLAWDVTEQQKLQAQERREAERFRTLIQASQDGFWLVSEDGHILDVNDAYLRMTGFTRRSLLGQPILALDGREGPEVFAAHLSRVQAEGRDRFETLHRTESGQLLDVEVSVSVVPDSGLLVCFIRNISREKRLRGLLHVLAEVRVGADGRGYFTSLAQALARAVGADFILVGEMSGEDRIQTLTVVENGQVRSNFQYDLVGSPCERALQQGLCIIRDRVADRFPEDLLLGELGIRAYVGIPLMDSQGEPNGVLVALFRRALEDVSLIQDLFRMVSGRTASEIERQRVQRSLVAQEALHRTIIERAPFPIFIHSGDRVRYGNPAMASLLKFGGPQELVGLEVLGLVHPECRELVRARIARAQATGKHAALVAEKFLAKDGTVVEVEVIAVPTALDGEPGMLVFALDVTERQEAERIRLRLEAEIQHAQRLDSLGSLAGGVAHDMNNVLGAILGMGAALQAGEPLPPKVGEGLDTILRAACRGRDLVKGLTDFTRKGLQQPQPLDLNDLVRQEVALLQRTTRQKVEVRSCLAEPLPKVQGEASSLSNALMNLCVNALDAMPQGGVLTLATEVLEGQVVVTLQDSGVGMAPEVLARALEPFFTTKPIGKGTGLGLSMVYGTMKAHGGGVELQSTPGEGTRVVLRFPILTEALPSPPEPILQEEAGPLPPLRVLIVDDDELIRATLPLMVELLGHRPEVASGGLEALRRLAAGLEVEVVILDLNMPGMDGTEVLDRLRLMRPDLPVVVSTGYKDSVAEQLLANHSRVEVLLKPATHVELDRCLRRVMA